MFATINQSCWWNHWPLSRCVRKHYTGAWRKVLRSADFYDWNNRDFSSGKSFHYLSKTFATWNLYAFSYSYLRALQTGLIARKLGLHSSSILLQKNAAASGDGEDVIEGKSEQVISDYSAISGERGLSPSDQEVSCKTFADQDLGNIQNLAKNGSVMSETSSGSSKSKQKMSERSFSAIKGSQDSSSRKKTQLSPGKMMNILSDFGKDEQVKTVALKTGISGKNSAISSLQIIIFCCANQDKLTAAIKDFRNALAICPSHRNTNKYLTATLVKYGIQQEKDGLLSEAVKSFNCALAIDRNQQTAKDRLEKIQLQINLKKEREKAAAKVEKGLKSRFSHVRDLILEEQSQAKRKRKRNDRKKKKKTMKSIKKKKKKKKKAGSKVRRRSQRSSDSSLSSSESSSEDERSKSESSDSNEEWVEKGTTAPTETRKVLEQHSKVQQEEREQMKSKLSTDETRVKRRDYPGTNHNDCGEYEDREPRSRKGSGEWSLYDARGISGISRSRAFEGVKGHEGNKCPSLSRSCEREKHGQSEGDWKDRKISHGVVGEQRNDKRGKTREQESSLATASNSSPSPASKLFVEKEIRRIRSRSDKGSERQANFAHCRDTEAVQDYSVQVCDEKPSFVVRLKDSENLAVFSKSREARLGQGMSSLESLNKARKRAKARKSSLVSYEDSSDEGSS